MQDCKAIFHEKVGVIRIPACPVKRNTSKCHMAYQASASTVFAPEAAGKVGCCVCSSAIHVLCVHAVKVKACTSDKYSYTIH